MAYLFKNNKGKLKFENAIMDADSSQIIELLSNQSKMIEFDFSRSYSQYKILGLLGIEHILTGTGGSSDPKIVISSFNCDVINNKVKVTLYNSGQSNRTSVLVKVIIAITRKNW